VTIQGAVDSLIIGSQGSADQLAAGEHIASLFHQDAQQVEFGGGEGDGCSVHLHLPPPDVQLYASRPQDLGLRALGSVTAKASSHSRHDLSRIVRLGDIVVRPHL
jgi:hypothetical protein